MLILSLLTHQSEGGTKSNKGSKQEKEMTDPADSTTTGTGDPPAPHVDDENRSSFFRVLKQEHRQNSQSQQQSQSKNAYNNDVVVDLEVTNSKGTKEVVTDDSIIDDIPNSEEDNAWFLSKIYLKLSLLLKII